MLFSSLPFLYYFLPIVLIAYFLAPGRWKNAVLLLASLTFYGWGEPRYLLLMLFDILLGFGGGLLIERSAPRSRRRFWCAAAAIGCCVALLGFFKYADFFLENLHAATGLSVPVLHLALPIGISFYTFQILSYLVDVSRADVPAERNLIRFATYVSLFPQLIAGPIVRYCDVAAELKERTHSWENYDAGLRRFIAGLGKKVLLANQLGALCETFRASGEKTVAFYWLYAIAFTLHIYFDFSGYSDMAIGLGRIFGFHFPENFRYPYVSASITEFWRRWHISLGSWFRDYVYIPLGGNRCKTARWLGNLLLVWLLTGLWHGAAWTFVLWGLLYAAALAVEKLFLAKLLTKAKPLGHVLTMLFVVLGFVIFNADSLAQAGSDLSALFGGGGLPLWGGETLYYLRSYAVVLLLSILGCTPLPHRLYERVATRRYGAVLATAGSVVLLLVCTAYLVDGSFNPFLYFRF